MTKKDYVMIARSINGSLKDADNQDQREGIDNVVFSLVAAFTSDNPLFDRKRFYDACYKGVEDK